MYICTFTVAPFHFFEMPKTQTSRKYCLRRGTIFMKEAPLYLNLSVTGYVCLSARQLRQLKNSFYFIPSLFYVAQGY